MATANELSHVVIGADADRNFDFPRVYQQKPLIEGVRVLKGGRARL